MDSSPASKQIHLLFWKRGFDALARAESTLAWN
jgi:hypothetical protein